MIFRGNRCESNIHSQALKKSIQASSGATYLKSNNSHMKSETTSK